MYLCKHMRFIKINLFYKQCIKIYWPDLNWKLSSRLTDSFKLRNTRSRIKCSLISPLLLASIDRQFKTLPRNLPSKINNANLIVKISVCKIRVLLLCRQFAPLCFFLLTLEAFNAWINKCSSYIAQTGLGWKKII